MGQSVIIACPFSWQLSTFEQLLADHPRRAQSLLSNSGHQLELIPPDREWKVIVRELRDREGAAADYTTNDDLPPEFRREAEALRYFVVTFDDVEPTRELLRAVAERAAVQQERVLIDTDHGWVIAASEAARSIDQDPSWDWGRPRSEH